MSNVFNGRRRSPARRPAPDAWEFERGVVGLIIVSGVKSDLLEPLALELVRARAYPRLDLRHQLRHEDGNVRSGGDDDVVAEQVGIIGHAVVRERRPLGTTYWWGGFGYG